MRFRIPEIFLGAFLAAAIFAIGILFSSQYRSETTRTGSSERAGGDTAKKDQPKPFWQGAMADPVAAFTLGLLVVGIFQAGFFFVQLRLIRESLTDTKVAADAANRAAKATENSVDLSRDTAKRQLRAYVTVNGVIRTKDPGDLGGSEGFAVLVDVKNNGQTPASDSLQWARIEIREFPLVTPLPLHCLENPTKGVLPPGAGAKNVMFPTFGRDLTTIEENAILANHTAIYVYGEIEYLDVFGDRHLTQFRFRCNGQGYPLGMFKPDGEGNEAT